MGTGGASGSGDIEWGPRGGGRYPIREVVARTSVPSTSIHHYRRAGLVPEPERIAANRFIYDDRHLTALRIIRSLRGQGRSFEDIRRALPELIGDDVDAVGTLPTRAGAELGDVGTRARLVAAAVRAFGEGGYRDVSVESLCSDAGVAKGTFYRHFGSKDSLFLAASAAVVERAIAGFERDVCNADPRHHAAIFARHLRPGLPVLLELAKRAFQSSGTITHTAANVFYDLASRLGTSVGSIHQPEQAGGLVIILAVVDIFARLVESELPAGRPSGDALSTL